jgi:hypothetical protein
MSLLNAAGGYDRKEIMRKAHYEFSAARRRGDLLPFGYWLAYAWRVAKGRREALEAEQPPKGASKRAARSGNPPARATRARFPRTDSNRTEARL